MAESGEGEKKEGGLLIVQSKVREAIRAKEKRVSDEFINALADPPRPHRGPPWTRALAGSARFPPRDAPRPARAVRGGTARACPGRPFVGWLAGRTPRAPPRVARRRPRPGQPGRRFAPAGGMDRLQRAPGKGRCASLLRARLPPGAYGAAPLPRRGRPGPVRAGHALLPGRRLGRGLPPRRRARLAAHPGADHLGRGRPTAAHGDAAVLSRSLAEGRSGNAAWRGPPPPPRNPRRAGARHRPAPAPGLRGQAVPSGGRRPTLLP